MKHLLVTNDFPPKIGGIQSYLWELWRRLPAEDVTVLTTPYEGDKAFDAEQAFRVVRTKQKWLLPRRSLVRRINSLAAEVGAELVVLDPALPLGLVGPKLKLPYLVVGHGAEFVIPGKIPFSKPFLKRVVGRSLGVIACGKYTDDFARTLRGANGRELAHVSVPPGVDSKRFVPLSDVERARAREKFGVTDEQMVVVGVSRLVPRKGFDRLVKAAWKLRRTHPDLRVLIAGTGREATKLKNLINETSAPVTMLGRVPDEDIPALYGMADVFCMPCHNRWMGLEQEGFGIVFVEASAAGVASVAGLSGGSAEAVADGEAGLLLKGRVSYRGVAQALDKLLSDGELRKNLATAGRARAVSDFDYDVLAERLNNFLNSAVSEGR